jgi:hypothetical protein
MTISAIYELIRYYLLLSTLILIISSITVDKLKFNKERKLIIGMILLGLYGVIANFVLITISIFLSAFIK